MNIKVNSNIFTTDSQGNLHLDIDIDTEYAHIAEPLNPKLKYCKNLTVQCRERHQDKGVIFAHPDIALEARHPVFETDFVVLDYLRGLGVDIEPIYAKSEKTTSDFPILQINLFAFFALAEIGRIFQGEYLRYIQLLLKFPDNNSGLRQTRRLIAFTQQGRKYYDYIYTPWLVSVNENVYRIALSILDTGAIHGKTSYKEFCHNSGIELEYKDNFTSEEKARMHIMYHERPKDFDNYALGDLYNYDALKLNSEKFEEIYKTLGLSEYFTPPKLTIGATVAKLFESGIHNLFGTEFKRSEIINKYCQYGSADRLKRENTTACLLAKVDGGRCRNNRPIETVHHGVLCDIDISGCYGNGLRIQTYPLGVPCILDYPRGYDCNKYLTLRQFLKKHNNDFLPGLWMARVTLKERYQLKYQQDYLMSWLPPNDINKMVTDSEFESTDQWWEIDNVGLIKIFKNEIHNAVITHDFVQWLENVATPRQRKELLDNLLVYSAGWYPKSLRVDTVEEMVKAHKNYKPKNTTEIQTKGKRRPKVAIQDMCHVWCGIELGELLIDKLLKERKKYPKKTPLNNLFKLCTNTVYGDMVSPFFKVGNVIVGNNITARARALAWCMEKGLNGWQTITDGCTFDLTKVPIARQKAKLSGENTIALYADNSKGDIQYKNLALEAYQTYTNNPNVIISNNEVIDQFYCMDANSSDSKISTYSHAIAVSAWKHLQFCFPNLDVLHAPTQDIKNNPRIGQFEFEVKGLFVRGTFHGSANYSLTYQDDKIAMRSYSKKPKSIVTFDDELEYLPEKGMPAKDFLLSLVNPQSVARSKVFIDERILKINDYRNHKETYFDSRVMPGYTIYKPRILREFSLSQFTFNSHQQYKSWKSEHERLIRKYSQSYEMFFLNDDGTVNYQKMIEEIELAIRQGKKRFSDIDKKMHRNYKKLYQSHDESECLEKLKDNIEDLYNYRED